MLLCVARGIPPYASAGPIVETREILEPISTEGNREQQEQSAAGPGSWDRQDQFPKIPYQSWIAIMRAPVLTRPNYGALGGIAASAKLTPEQRTARSQAAGNATLLRYGSGYYVALGTKGAAVASKRYKT